MSHRRTRGESSPDAPEVRDSRIAEPALRGVPRCAIRLTHNVQFRLTVGVPRRARMLVDGRKVQHRSTATGADPEGRGRTSGDGDLRVRMSVDVLPVVCKQGVRGSSPLNSTQT